MDPAAVLVVTDRVVEHVLDQAGQQGLAAPDPGAAGSRAVLDGEVPGPDGCLLVGQGRADHVVERQHGIAGQAAVLGPASMILGLSVLAGTSFTPAGAASTGLVHRLTDAQVAATAASATAKTASCTSTVGETVTGYYDSEDHELLAVDDVYYADTVCSSKIVTHMHVTAILLFNDKLVSSGSADCSSHTGDWCTSEKVAKQDVCDAGTACAGEWTVHGSFLDYSPYKWYVPPKYRKYCSGNGHTGYLTCDEEASVPVSPVD
jgi:hypothetical protein